MKVWNILGATVVVALLGSACGGGDPVVLGIESLEPTEGPLGGGQTVMVTGEGFLTGGSAPNMALFGESLTSNVSALSDSELRIVTPPGIEPGEVDVIIFNANGYGIESGAYTYVGPPSIESVDAPSGHYKGGETVTITGEGFQEFSAGVATVTFDGKVAGDVVVVDDTELTATVPAGEPYQLADVAVENNRGRAELADAYEYELRGLLAMTGRRFGVQGQLYWVDIETGEVFPRGEADFIGIHGMATDDEGVVYGFAPDDAAIYRIDPMTGAKEYVGDTITTDVKGESYARVTDLEFHDGDLYATDLSNGYLGTINTSTGAFTRLSVDPQIATSGNAAAALVSDGETLYYTRNGQVFTVNTQNGTVVLVAGVTLAQNRALGLTSVDGQVYAVTRSSGGKGNVFGGGIQFSNIWTVDLENGNFNFVATLPSAAHAMAVSP